MNYFIVFNLVVSLSTLATTEDIQHNAKKRSSDFHALHGELISKQVQIENEEPVIKYAPVPVHVPHPIGVPVQVPVHVPEPVPVHVPVPITILKTVEVPVEKPVPYLVQRPYPVEIIQQVPVEVPKPVPVHVPVYRTKHIYHTIIHPQKHGWLW